MTADLGSRLGWYVRRLRRMSPAEVAWRLEDRARQEWWARRTFPVPDAVPGALSGPSGAAPPGPGRRGAVADAARNVPAATVTRVRVVADELLAGRGELLGVLRDDLAEPTWSLDPISGRAYPADRSAFRIDYRAPADGRNVKQVWELSRHHHLTVLALAWRLTGDERYARRAADHLASWWRSNPVATGVNWTSGIEVGIRLVSWVWVRRLLEGWLPSRVLFEANPLCRQQVYWHEQYLADFRSRGSSANNHAIAEAAGLLVAACGFPWFAESARWQHLGRERLEASLCQNTFASGLDREQAFEYHGFVAELGLVAAVEAAAAGVRMAPATWQLLCRMVDAVAAVLDRAGGPPRYGDGDGGRALVLDDPAVDRWGGLLALGAALFGPLPWWPDTVPSAQSVLVAALVPRGELPRCVPERPPERPSTFPDAGLTILRASDGSGGELWCRCDGGPHGFLSIAAHAHADALALELRHDGVELLVDPGTFCYHDDPAWRRYFRSTVAHNTVEIDRSDQSEPGGPFLWSRHASTRVLECTADGPRPRWTAEHDGYQRLPAPVLHRRTVELDGTQGRLTIVDELVGDGAHEVRLAFHLGPAVGARLDGSRAVLRWPWPLQTGVAAADGTSSGLVERVATMVLPSQLCWQAYRGTVEPIAGWYSPGFGQKVATTTLVGTGRLSSCRLTTEMSLAISGTAGRPVPDREPARAPAS